MSKSIILKFFAYFIVCAAIIVSIVNTHKVNKLEAQVEILQKSQPVIDKNKIDGLIFQFDNIDERLTNTESELSGIRTYMRLSDAVNQKPVRTNVRPEYEIDKAGRKVRNSDTIEQAMKNCDPEQNLINFMQYGEPHPSCR